MSSGHHYQSHRKQIYACLLGNVFAHEQILVSAYLHMHQGNDNQLHRPEFKDITDDVLQTCEHAQELDRRCKHVGELDSGHIQISLCVCVCSNDTILN